jgi:hypothetical protein
LKACGVVTGAAAKRNPVYAPNIASGSCAARFMLAWIPFRCPWMKFGQHQKVALGAARREAAS